MQDPPQSSGFFSHKPRQQPEGFFSPKIRRKVRAGTGSRINDPPNIGILYPMRAHDVASKNRPFQITPNRPSNAIFTRLADGEVNRRRR
jgi:hypothetical protein